MKRPQCRSGEGHERLAGVWLASVFLDALNVFLFFLRIFSREN